MLRQIDRGTSPSVQQSDTEGAVVIIINVAEMVVIGIFSDGGVENAVKRCLSMSFPPVHHYHHQH